MGEIVAGRCPMGCISVLTVADGRLRCPHGDCPRPSAAAEILADHEAEHIIALTRHDFTIRHPLRERLDDALMDCHFHHYLEALNGPPYKPGRYRVRAPADFPENWEKLG